MDDDDDAQQLRIFDSSLHRRTQSIKDSVNSGSNGAGSLSSLILVISCLGETNQDVVDILRRSKVDIYRSPELRSLVNDYFRYSHNTLEFLNILEHWLNGWYGVSWKLQRIRSALTEFKKANKTNKTKTRFRRATSLKSLQRALSGFTSTEASDGDSVARQFNRKLADILDEQNRLHERLVLDQRREDDFQRQGRLNTYRKISTVILASLYIGLLACAVAAALSTMHPQIVIAVAVAIGSMNPTGQVERLVKYLLSKYEEKLRERSELLRSLTKAGNRMTVEDLEVVKEAVEGLEERLKGLSTVGRYYMDPELKSMVDDMEKKIDELSKKIKELQTKKDKCYKDVTNARRKICGGLWGRSRSVGVVHPVRMLCRLADPL